MSEAMGIVIKVTFWEMEKNVLFTALFFAATVFNVEMFFFALALAHSSLGAWYASVHFANVYMFKELL